MCSECGSDCEAYANPFFQASTEEIKANEASKCQTPTDQYPTWTRALLRRHLDYEDDGEKPPFTPRQMIAAALLCDGTDLQFEFLIPKILFNTFKYYSESPCPSWPSHDYFKHCNCRRHSLSRALLEELDDCYSPFVIGASNHAKPHDGFQDDLIGKGGTKRPLQRLLQGLPSTPNNVWPFRFLDLPPEIRNMVYKEVLHSGLVVHHAHSNDRFFGSRPCQCGDWAAHKFHIWRDDRELPSVDPNKLLAVLSVNRQIYSEAVPVFYGENEFIFANLSMLHNFLKNISLPRRQALRDVTVRYGYPGYWTNDSKVATAAFRLLKDSIPLKSFCMNMPEDLVLGRTARIKEPEDIPGIKQLKTLRGIPDLQLYNCPRVKAYLLPEMSKPFVESDKSPVGKEDKPLIRTKRKLRASKGVKYTNNEYDDAF